METTGSINKELPPIMPNIVKVLNSYPFKFENFLLTFWFRGALIHASALTSASTSPCRVYPLTPLMTTALTTHFWKAKYKIMIGITLTMAPAVARLCSI